MSTCSLDSLAKPQWADTVDIIHAKKRTLLEHCYMNAFLHYEHVMHEDKSTIRVQELSVWQCVTLHNLSCVTCS